jgi:hypothetical protein
VVTKKLLFNTEQEDKIISRLVMFKLACDNYKFPKELEDGNDRQYIEGNDGGRNMSEVTKWLQTREKNWVEKT